MNDQVLDLEPYISLIDEVVKLHSCNMMDRYFGAEPKVQIYYVPDEKKPLFHQGFEISGHGDTIREKMLDNPLAPLFVSFTVIDDRLAVSFGILEGEEINVIFKLEGQTLEAMAQTQFRMFLMREEERLAKANLKPSEFLLTFKEMVEMHSPKPTISFFVIMNQENLGDILSS